MFGPGEQDKPHRERKITRVERLDLHLALCEWRVPLAVIHINLGFPLPQFQLGLPDRVAPRAAVSRYPEVQVRRAVRGMVAAVNRNQGFNVRFRDAGLRQPCPQSGVVERKQRLVLQGEQTRFVLIAADDHRDFRGFIRCFRVPRLMRE